METIAKERRMEIITEALIRLTEHGVPTDIQEILVHGNVSLGVPPGALEAVLFPSKNLCTKPPSCEIGLLT